MSRTIKRKNFEKTYCPHNNGYAGGGKIAGFYTAYRLVRDENYFGIKFCYVYSEPTKAERFERYKFAHRERTPFLLRRISKRERKIEEHAARARNRAQMPAVIHGLKDQVVITAHPNIDPGWWW